nr:uncharacterized protein CXorf49 homolog [Equus asinus]XP_044619893.1 uncharacterized protein CXorf49 homolog [Equus asinus]
MSSPEEGSVWGAGFGPEGGARAGVRPAEPGALRAVGLGPALGAPRSGEGEGGFPQPGGRPSCPADGRDAAADCASYPAPPAAANVVQQLTRRGVCTYRSPESCAARGSTVWAGLEPGAGGPGAPALSWVASQPASAALLPLPGPEGGPAWGSPKRGGRSRLGSPASRGRPSAGGPVRLPSDPEPSDEASELQPTRVSLCPGEGGQAQPNGPEHPGDPPRRSSFPARENFLHVPGSFLPSAARAFALAVERRAVGGLDFSSSKKVECVVWGKGGKRPSYQAAAAAAAAAGGVPSRATPWRKAAPEKKSLGAASQVAQGRTFLSWGQRASAAPLDPATFPPVSGVPLLVRCRRAKQSKQPGTGKKSVAGRTMESQPVEVAGEDIDPNSDPAPRGQPPGHRPGPCSRCVRRPEGSSGHLNTRAAPQVAGNPQCLARSQGNTVPRGPAPSGDQEPLDRPPGRQRQQQPRGARGCPRCHVLQREIGDLKEHLAAVLSLADKFQSL